MTEPQDDTVLRILRRARGLITEPEHWTKNAFARDAKADVVAVGNEAATCFCSVGAIERAKMDENEPYSTHLLAFEVAASMAPIDWRDVHRGGPLPLSWLMSYNDDTARKHAEVLEVFDKAIARLESLA